MHTYIKHAVTALCWFAIFVMGIMLFAWWFVPKADAATQQAGIEIILTPHHVVQGSNLPECDDENNPSNIPCSWNFNSTPPTGNGEGLAFYYDERSRTTEDADPKPHYVWAQSPVQFGWKWVTGYMRQQLRDAGLTLSMSCAYKHAGDDWSRVKCANGNRFTIGW